jgi:hypothetical protein
VILLGSRRSGHRRALAPWSNREATSQPSLLTRGDASIGATASFTGLADFGLTNFRFVISCT